jgi:hypothetical protein
MSETEKRTPISVYLTPKAAMTLADFNRGSGYGSVSRTVEEIILAFDSIYRTIETLKQQIPSFINQQLSDAQKLQFFLSLATTLMNVENAVSRLQPATVKEVGE